MIILEAPFENPEKIIFLPNPLFNNNLSLGISINQKVSINNTRYTYVKRKAHHKIKYTFILSLEKCFELQEFIELYLITTMKLVSYKNEIWAVKIVSDPFIYTPKTVDERTEISLSFDGIRINAPSINC